MMNGAWKVWKSGFDRWEKTTASYLDKTLRSQAVLGPSSAVLKLAMQTKTGTDRLMALWWKSLGLTHREEQDLAMHRINQLESRILDLQEEISELKEGQ